MSLLNGYTVCERKQLCSVVTSLQKGDKRGQIRVFTQRKIELNTAALQKNTKSVESVFPSALVFTNEQASVMVTRQRRGREKKQEMASYSIRLHML